MGIFRGLVIIETADTPKLELRVCGKFKCKCLRHVKSVHKLSGGGCKCANTAIFDNFEEWLP